MKTTQHSRTGALFAGVPFLRLKQAMKPLYIKRIVLLGDSVAYGYGTQGGLATYLKQTFPDSEVTNFGINGLTSDGLVERLQLHRWDEAIREADLVILNIGGNDLLRAFKTGGPQQLIRQFGQLKRNYRKNLLEIYRYIRDTSSNAMIVQNNLYNSMKKEVQYFGFTNLLITIWNTAIGEKDIIVARLNAMGKNRSIWLDSIHPNEDGYKIMNDLLKTTLADRGYSVHSGDH
ncbi:SGNH/GDSL hydrolase family protein [Planococcus lenghuensis]|uniref:SGNH/GDSL hydrolase family protein n=1 Tax=Planococcus lenghuensis TaxID=2213202 RepID=UPI0018DE441F|nr:GDSL-type esterase/lipase family protein [Planococcus lenghuensis]